jgi:hypothetical protein
MNSVVKLFKSVGIKATICGSEDLSLFLLVPFLHVGLLWE